MRTKEDFLLRVQPLFLSPSSFLPAEQIRGRWMSGLRADSEGAGEATK